MSVLYPFLLAKLSPRQRASPHGAVDVFQDKHPINPLQDDRFIRFSSGFATKSPLDVVFWTLLTTRSDGLPSPSIGGIGLRHDGAINYSHTSARQLGARVRIDQFIIFWMTHGAI